MKPIEVTPGLLRDMPLPDPDETDDKDGRGRLLVAGGTVELPGAVLLAGVAGLRAGAGKLQLATVASIAPFLGVAVPECRVVGLPQDAQGGIAAAATDRLLSLCNASDAVLLGPGTVATPETEALVTGLVRRLDGPSLVVDAGALCCARSEPDLFRQLDGRVALTPHAGEMAAMLELSRADITRSAGAIARRAAARFGAVIALKGATTYIADRGDALYVHRYGCVGLATSGSGDTLGGIVAGLLARGATALQAVLWAVFLHGAAGRLLSRRHGIVGFLARELLDEIPALMAKTSHAK
jgi:ADP-dependent NAD(P)H-hydrate dehydratase